MDGLRHAVHSAYLKVAEAAMPPLSQSKFEEKRVLTPQEFVASGDYLVRACPTWSWEGGDPARRRPYLPPDKQYLVTRNVPCLTRASDLEAGAAAGEFALGGDDDGWTATHRDPSAAGGGAAAGGSAAAAAGGSGSGTGARAGAGGSDDDDGIPTLDDDDAAAAAALPVPVGAGPAVASSSVAATAGGGDDGDDGDVPDIDDLDLGGGGGDADDDDDEAAVPSRGAAAAAAASAPSAASSGSTSTAAAANAALRRTRTYDLHITYDQYYQVPRFWLIGYDEARAPLKPAQVLEDVSEDHARKTITLDPHPHLGSAAASIHPCRHAEVMKKLADRLVASGCEFRADQYLVLFLKFIASVVPTIEYDYTLSVGGGG